MIDRRLAITLAAVAGALNATALDAAGYFSANMTGNVSLLASQIASRRWGEAAFFASIVAVFVMGSMASTLFISAGRRRGNRNIYAMTILIEAMLLACLAAAVPWLAPSRQGACIVWGLAFLMGLQNATVTRISDARVRTTHVSGMITDIGIELALLLDFARDDAAAMETGAIFKRLRLHLETVSSFVVGGAAGMVLHRAVGARTLWIVALALALMALPPFVSRSSREEVAFPPDV